MLFRSKRTFSILIFVLAVLTFCLYRLPSLNDKVTLMIAKRLLANHTKPIKVADGSHGRKFSQQDASKLFEENAKCLANAKKDIASYLTQSNTLSTRPGNTNGKLEPKCSTKFLLLILVTSRPGNFANRAAIRLSWGRMDSSINRYATVNYKGFTWRTLFSVGLATSANIGNIVTMEHETFGDILRLPYEDSYKNLPNKTMNSLEWIADNCQPRYVLKTDDDCFINILEMLSWLQTLPASYQYIGRVNTEMPVIRDPKHRNYVPKEQHKENVYKPYCAGGGYILKGDIIKNVTIIGKKIKQIINEDAYMGMLTNALRIKPVNEERFLPFIFFGPPVKKLNMCDWRDKFLVHNVLGKRQLIMHFNSIAMKNFKSVCEIL